MTTRTILATVAALVAAALTTTALAASTAKDPKTMVLQKSDFLPARASLWREPETDKNPQVSTYAVYYRYKTGSKTFDLISTASVMNPRLAKSAWREVRTLVQGDRKLSLPKYGGTEQVAGLAREDNAGQLWVLKGGTIWSISVLGPITTADAVAQLQRFGPLQQKRVGSG